MQQSTLSEQAFSALASGDDARFRVLAETLPLIVWATDAHGVTDYLSARWYEYTGVTPAIEFGEASGRNALSTGNWAEFIHVDDRDRALAAWTRCLASGQPFESEYRLRRHDGQYRWFLGRAVPARGADGQIMRWFGSATDIDDTLSHAPERDALIAQLRESSRRLDAVLNNASVAVFLMDEQQHCVYMNPAAEKLTGYSLEETRGRPLHDVLHHTRPDGSHYPLEECPIDRAFPENNQEQGEEIFVHKDGSFYPVAFTASPLRDERARIVGTIIEVRDIRREKETLEAMREADRRKDEFIAMLSHELRNPLEPLMNALWMLDRSPAMGERERLALTMAQRQMRQLTRLVNDLLDVSRITRGRVALMPETMVAQSAVRDAEETTRLLLKARRQPLELEMPEEPVTLVADPARVAQMLENLINNASKFSPDGAAIRVALVARQDDVEIRVIDRGIGIDPRDASKLFQPFIQITTTPDRDRGGLGIGLALVRTLAEMHGGSVRAESAGRGHGSTFVLSLPRVAVCPGYERGN